MGDARSVLKPALGKRVQPMARHWELPTGPIRQSVGRWPGDGGSQSRPRSMPYQYRRGSTCVLSSHMLYRSFDWSNGKDSFGLLS